MGRQLTVTVNGVPFDVEVLERSRDSVRFAVQGRSYEVEFAKEAPVSGTVASRPSAGAHKGVPAGSAAPALRDAAQQRGAPGSGSGQEVRSPMPGVVVAVSAEVGAKVEAGETLVTIEAMKMQNSIVSPSAGVVKEIAVQAGDEVMDGAVLLRLEAAS